MKPVSITPKPARCPQCDSARITVIGHNQQFAHCRDCGCNGASTNGRDNAIKQWNKGKVDASTSENY